jgi:hypothetical protein
MGSRSVHYGISLFIVVIVLHICVAKSNGSTLSGSLLFKAVDDMEQQQSKNISRAFKEFVAQ